MKLSLRFSVVCFSLLLLLGCKKGDVCRDLDIIETHANLLWTGYYELDGCGFRIQIGEKIYKPENEEDIDDSFKTLDDSYISSRGVKLKYLPRGNRLNVSCGMSPTTQNIDYLYVISVERL